MKKKIVENYYRENYNRHINNLKWILNGDEASAEDVYHEAITRSLTYLKHFDSSKGEFKSWFNRILYNSLQDYRNSSKGIVKEDVKHIENLLEDFDTSFISENFDTIVDLMKSPLFQENTEILKLVLIYGYSSNDIRDITGFSSSYIRTIIFRFRIKLKELYDDRSQSSSRET